MSTKMLSAVRSLYQNVSACVRVNGYLTDWFKVNTGVRQGCSLSTILFNIFLNDIAVMLKSLHKGVTIGNENVCILLYADDIVLIEENENDLQTMLTTSNDWCKSNSMCISIGKSNIVHFRPDSLQRSEYIFKCGESVVQYANSY